MLRTEKKEINGHTYSNTQFTAIEGLPIRAKLSKSDMGDVALILQLLSKTTRNDESITRENFNRFYNNDQDELETAIEFVIEENFLRRKGTGAQTTKSEQNPTSDQQES